MTCPSVATTLSSLQNDDDCFTLIPANKASPDILDTVAIWLSQQWPRGGNAAFYLDKITEDKGSDSMCPCSFILMKHGATTPVGHGRVLDCFENSGARAAAFTYIIAKPQGNGHGRILMQQLERACRDQNYHYVYVWTHTAIEFYKKCGYHETHRVSLQRPCLKILETMQVSKLEDLLSFRKRRIFKDEDDHIADKHDAADGTTKKRSETILLPPVHGAEIAEQQDVWLCKRLVDTVPKLTIQREERMKELQAFCSSSMACGSCYYHFLDLAWQQQIGPSCGLAALQMVLDFSKGGAEDEEYTTKKQPSLLQQAKTQQYTRDGELFDIQDLFSLAKQQNLDCEIVRVSDTTQIQVCQQLLALNPIIIPYDQSYNKLPCLANGKCAHYGVIVGMMILCDKPLDAASSLMLTEEESSWDSHQALAKRLVPLTTIRDDTDDNDDHPLARSLQVPSTSKLYLLVQHGMSRKLCIASWNDFMISNEQLHGSDHAKFFSESNRRINLANQMLVFKEKSTTTIAT
jgi:GNAT superfamily N-acetyltransferase